MQRNTTDWHKLIAMDTTTHILAYRSLKQNKSPNISVNKTLQHQLLHTARSILHQNYFRFHYKFYEPSKGAAMGISISGLTDEIFLLFWKPSH